MTADLVTFLRTCLDEDERVARAAIREDWRRPADGQLVHDDGVWARDAEWIQECRVEGVGITIYDEGGHTRDQADHIARWDPACVLAEVAAKRRIIDAVDDGTGLIDLDYTPQGKVIRALAQAYAGRPGWREEWAT